MVKTKRFKRNLPKGYGFVFEDPRPANAFYMLINHKLDLDPVYFFTQGPFELAEKRYHLSVYECERTLRILNIILMFIDNKREQNDSDPLFEDYYYSRKGYWYIVLMVADDEQNDCLAPEHPDRERVITFLESLRKEYYDPVQHLDAYLKGKLQ